MKSMRKLFSVMLAMCVLLLSGTAMAATDITGGVIRVEGVSGVGQSFALKRIAAKVDAQRLLAEQIHGVQIDSNTTVENAIVTSDVVKASVSGVVKGAREVSCTTDEYGYVHVVMELPLYGGANSLAAAVIPNVPQQGFLPPSDIIPVDTKPAAPAVTTNPNQATVGNLYGATGQYTGLIVDCSGLGLQTAMAPALYTDGKKVVYGLENFSHEQVINRGYVGYSNSASSGVQRAGSNPMVVKAQSIEHFFNPVISKEDAARILAENQMNGFLSTGNVVFVK
ncbi:LPP20 family lipoprotein [Anaerovibrio sp.]|uniref:LPP20 family lipoprotein n=1 Tax=Anaerovibrio sp. TaxID=1872532 RepID=UPI00261D3200|nr:LPP20 family lipoprotein [Anaerovibrio sp.]MDD6597551.1 LPP20 family lipoprotein [Anaerovibrio sp.]